jgi:hypothetical protein
MRQATIQSTRSADAANKAIDQSRDQFTISERPYVWAPDARYLIPGGSKPIVVKFVLVNYGKSPAMEERGENDVFFGPMSLDRADDWFKLWGKKMAPSPGHDMSRYGSVSILPPAIPADISTGGEAALAYSRDIPSATDVIDDVGNRLQIVAVGHFEYKDLAGRPYYTNICYIRIPNITVVAKGEMAKCNEHNQIR